MNFLCHPVYKYLILIISLYLIFKNIMKLTDPNKTVFVTVFIVLLIDMIIIDNYYNILINYNNEIVNNEDDDDDIEQFSVISNNKYSDNGIPNDKYENIELISNHL